MLETGVHKITHRFDYKIYMKKDLLETSQFFKQMHLKN